MKRFLPILFFLLFLSSNISSQNNWQEHFSHDRVAYAHHGHFVVDGKIVLLMGNEKIPMNTIETITGNTKKTQEVIAPYFTFFTKTTRTGLDSKEILLKEPFDYDISGFGAYSIYERDDSFLNRDIQGDVNQPYDDYLYIIDAYMSGGPLDNKECITYDKRYYLSSDDEVLAIENLTDNFTYFEGLDGLPYQIIDGTLSSIASPIKGPLDLGTYRMILNNPYKNQLVVVKDSSIHSFSYDDFSFVSADLLEAFILEIQFIEGGLYYLAETDNSYMIYQYSDETSTSELFYQIQKTEEVTDFKINNFEVIGDDIYFFGLLKSALIKENFSYVQRRSLNEAFTPNRKDIELTSLGVTREAVSNYQYIYNLTYKVKNLSLEPINHFTLYTPKNDPGFGPNSYVKIDVNQEIAPGASFEATTNFTIYGYPKNKLTFYIEGVDYGLDSDMTNNSYTADVVILSNNDLEEQNFTISPNPSTEFITISGQISEIESITISDIGSRNIIVPNTDMTKIDISALQAGQYWLQIQTKANVLRKPFIKL